MEQAEYTWTDFYSEFADKLLGYKSDRPALIKKLQKIYETIKIKIPKLDTNGVPEDIDPFTVFGLFNKRITDANRKKIIDEIASEFGLKAEKPESFVVPRCFVWVKKNYFPGDWRFVHYARRGYFSDGPWAHPAMAS